MSTHSAPFLASQLPPVAVVLLYLLLSELLNLEKEGLLVVAGTYQAFYEVTDWYQPELVLGWCRANGYELGWLQYDLVQPGTIRCIAVQPRAR